MPDRHQYIAITPVKDEEELISGLIRSFESQTVKPLMWYIVDDGSRDSSREIAKSFSQSVSWCHVIELENRQRRIRGPAVVSAIRTGLSLGLKARPDYIVKVDADITFDSNLFEDLLDRMGDNPTLGIAGPNIMIKRKGCWVSERELPSEFVRGPIRAYRAKCYRDIGGIVPAKGWDAIDLLTARTKGWKVHRFDELQARMRREIGAATGFIRSSYEDGRGSYFMGSHWSYMLLEAAEFARRTPLIIRGLLLIAGYCIGAIRRKRIVDEDVIALLREQQKEIVRRRFHRR